MRLCPCLPLALATAAALVSGPAVALDGAPEPPLAAADDREPTCAGADSGTFPIRTRIRGGPATYVAGGGFHTWALELTNTTSRTCTNIHPVVVLVDDARTLKRTQPQLEFYEDAKDTTARPVTFERTDSDELVGVLGGDGDGGGTGFTVPPGRTLTVRVRLSLTSDAAVPNDVVAKAAVVERRGDDGEWVGESDDYRFRITDGEEAGEDGEESREQAGEEAGEDGEEAREQAGEDAGEQAGEEAGEDGEEAREQAGEDAGKEVGKDAGKEVGKDAGKEVGEEVAGKEVDQDGGGGAADGDPEAVRSERPHADELAESGTREALPYVTGLLLLSVGGLLVVAVRRRAR